MTVTKRAKAVDAAFCRRFNKLRPKARFKELSKGDQYTLTARTLSSQLEEMRLQIGGTAGKLSTGLRLTLRSISSRYIEIDPGTGLLTTSSIKKSKRAIANAFKKVFGADTQFMFVIEQQDKNGELCPPHVHAIAIVPFDLERNRELRLRLQRIAGDLSPDSVKFQCLSIWSQRTDELAPAEASFRRSAQYDMKNDKSICYRSKSLLVHVHKRFEELKQHYGISP